MHSDWSTGDWICSETSLIGPGDPAGQEEDSHGGNRLGWHVSEGRWTNIPRGPAHQGSRKKRRVLPAEISLVDRSRQLSSLWASHGCWGQAGWRHPMKKLEAWQDVPTPVLWMLNSFCDSLWQTLLQASRSTAEWSPLLLQPIALFPLTVLGFGGIQCRSLTCAADLDSSQKAGRLPSCQSGSDF